jgi:hypothetical protein
MKRLLINTMLIAALSTLIPLTACSHEDSTNLLLKQQYTDDKPDENRQSAEFLFQLAMSVQPKINESYGLKARHADFYIGCMQSAPSPKGACDALYQAMAEQAQISGKPNLLETRSYVGLTAKDIKSLYMWKILSTEVIADNDERVAWEGH